MKVNLNFGAISSSAFIVIGLKKKRPVTIVNCGTSFRESNMDSLSG